jgi:glycosyltransferase involved in cell wall biosynthesis
VKVLIVNNMAPFVRGGAELLAEHLCTRLNRTPGVQSEVLRVPFRWEPFERVADQILLNLAMELVNVDRVIALKFPAYLIPHPSKTVWLIHQYRQAYDLRGTDQSNLPATPRGDAVRSQIISADNASFKRCRKLYVSSSVVRDRLKRFNGFDAEVLNAPLNYPEHFRHEDSGDYLFAGGRINLAKRQHMLVEAMAHVRSEARLIVAGPPDSDEDGQRLHELVRRHSLEDRVSLDLGFHEISKIASYANNAAACAYLPIDEDSLGYVTMEACAASKAVLSTTDAGGILQLVVDGQTGLVTEADPRALAEGIDELFANRRRMEKMGRAAKALWDSKHIDWPTTIEKLLA